eukprot:4829235-Pyramimonas_sp.AAC.1
MAPKKRPQWAHCPEGKPWATSMVVPGRRRRRRGRRRRGRRRRRRRGGRAPSRGDEEGPRGPKGLDPR